MPGLVRRPDRHDRAVAPVHDPHGAAAHAEGRPHRPVEAPPGPRAREKRIIDAGGARHTDRRMATTASHRPSALANRVPPQMLFMLGAVSQYVGSAVAVLIFEVVPAAGVAWLRVAAAGVALSLWRKPWQNRSWTRRSFATV